MGIFAGRVANGNSEVVVEGFWGGIRWVWVIWWLIAVLKAVGVHYDEMPRMVVDDAYVDLGSPICDFAGLDEPGPESACAEECDGVLRDEGDDHGCHGCAAEVLGYRISVLPVARFLYC